MEYVVAQGAAVPKIGLGTWQLRGTACRRVVETALDLGYRHMDTAQNYRNERQVGAAINNSTVDREDVFLVTKLSPTNLSEQKVKESTYASLARLNTEYVDCLLIHRPNPLVPLRETLDAMNDLVEEGVVHHIGVSNFSQAQLMAARDESLEPILTNQVRYTPFDRKQALVEYCQIHDVVLTAYSPFLHGGLLTDSTLSGIGLRYKKSAAQVALRWLIQQDNVVAIPKASSYPHLKDNLEVFDFKLTDHEMERIGRPSTAKTVSGTLRGFLAG
ncbi:MULTISPECIES: aldo/keto reductase [unclassified Haladaptatus]|uniref:aldo/keto reductase n=1 Tax=unclassified Haladaptatus TaxID=2622732 RepID=UPI0023E82B05|nr:MULTISPECIES: aldo/keto reductase [unclassified Haladaptatus]